MFKCQKCKKISEPYERQHKLVVEKRDRIYRFYLVKVRGHYNKIKEIYTETKPDEKDKNKQILKQFTKKGWEIVKEIRVCKECAK